MNCLLVSQVVSLFFLFVAFVCLFFCYILLLVFLVWWMSVWWMSYNNCGSVAMGWVKKRFGTDTWIGVCADVKNITVKKLTKLKLTNDILWYEHFRNCPHPLLGINEFRRQPAIYIQPVFPHFHIVSHKKLNGNIFSC